MKILFVCSSNVCRSPYAEFVFRRIVAGSPVLSAAVTDVSSSAVFNKSNTIFPKAVVSLEREGFKKEEILAFKPSFNGVRPKSSAKPTSSSGCPKCTGGSRLADTAKSS